MTGGPPAEQPAEQPAGPAAERVRRLSSGGPWEEAVGYSRAVVVDGRVIVSGCTATVAGRVQHPDDPYQQTLVALRHAADALSAAGTDLTHVVRTRMYVVHRRHCESVGAAHREVLGAVRPAATMVVVAGLLDPAMLVEVEVEAVLPT